MFSRLERARRALAAGAAGILLTTAACSHESEATASAASATAPRPPADTAATRDAAVPHGDHAPHHRGIVFMHGDTHFEVVLGRDGTHRVYFSDAVRADLPAAVASDLIIVVQRAGAPPETLAAHIDEAGESWIAVGRPVGAGDASARISFTSAAGPYFIDTPFMAPVD